MLVGLAASALTVLVFAAPAHPASPVPKDKEKSFDEVLGGLQFRSIGPYRGGRACAPPRADHARRAIGPAPPGRPR